MGLSYADTQWTLPANATPEEKAWADKGLSWQTRLWIDDMFMITILQAQAYHTTWKREGRNRLHNQTGEHQTCCFGSSF